MMHCTAGIILLLAGRQSAPMTLDEALRVAEQNAHGLKISRTNVQRAKARLDEARGQRGPKVTADTNYTRFDRELSTQFGGNTIVTRPIDSTQSSVSLAMPIDLGGILGHAVNAAMWALRATEDQYLSDLNELRFRVKEAYFSVLQGEESVRVFRENLRAAQSRLSQIEARYRAGEVARVDVLRIETLVRQAEADLVAAQNRLELARFFFNSTLGRAIETPVELQPVLLNPVPEGDEGGWTRTALHNRRDLAALRNQARSLQAVTRTQRAGLTPSVGVSVKYTHDWEAQGFSAAANSTVGVIGLTVPIYDSGVTRARVEAARKDEEALGFRIQQLELSVSLEVRQAVSNWRNAQARLALAEQQVKTAEENFRLAELRFNEGEGINLEVIDAQNQLVAAQVARAAALFDAQVAFADLQRAVGSDSLGPNAGGGSR